MVLFYFHDRNFSSVHMDREASAVTLMCPADGFNSFPLLPKFFIYNLLSLILLGFHWDFSILKALPFLPKYLLWSLCIQICLIHLKRDIEFPTYVSSIF